MLGCAILWFIIQHNAYFRLPPVSDIYISYVRCRGMFKYEFVANVPLSLAVKEFWKSVNMRGSYGQEFIVLFLTHRVEMSHVLWPRMIGEQLFIGRLILHMVKPYTNLKVLVFTARCYASVVLAMGLCPSVRLCLCLSVTSRCSTKTAKRRITQITPHNTPGSLVFWCQRRPRNSTGVTPYEGAECRWGGQNRRLLTNNRLFLDNGKR